MTKLSTNQSKKSHAVQKRKEGKVHEKKLLQTPNGGRWAGGGKQARTSSSKKQPTGREDFYKL